MVGRSSAPGPSPDAPGPLRETWAARMFFAFWGLPSGVVGRVGARMLPFFTRGISRATVEALALREDDDLLDVGCGAGALLGGPGARARVVAGIDASEIQVRLARRRLARRIRAGTAQIELGDAAALPWPDGRFSAVTSVNCLKFMPDPERALLEMHRVLRRGGRLVHVTDPPVSGTDASGRVDAFGIRQWSADDSRRMMERAGFTEVSVVRLPRRYLRLQLVRGVRPE